MDKDLYIRNFTKNFELKFLLTLDVEPDYSTRAADPYLHLTVFSKAMRKLVKEEIPVIMFVCGVIAEKYSELLLDCIDKVEIGVHTHPILHVEKHVRKINIASDKLKDYAFNEQVELIRSDLESITTNFGVRPRCFRAGKLAANDATLDAIKALEINVDSSLYIPYIFKPKAILRKPWTPFTYKGLVRIPVMSYDNELVKPIFRIKRLVASFSSPNSVGCLLLHSWAPSIEKIIDKLLPNNFVSLDEVLQKYGKHSKT